MLVNWRYDSLSFKCLRSFEIWLSRPRHQNATTTKAIEACKDSMIPLHWNKNNRDELKLISSQCRIYASVNRVSIGWDNGLSSIRHQAIISTNADLLSIGPMGTNFSDILIKIHNFSLKKCTWKFRLRNADHFVQRETWVKMRNLMWWNVFEHGSYDGAQEETREFAGGTLICGRHVELRVARKCRTSHLPVN